MILADTSDIIEIVLGNAVSTNEFQYNSYYADHTSSAFTPGATSGTSNGTSAVTIVSSPGSSTQRQVKYITIYNNDVIANYITVRFDDGTNERILIKILMQPGETLEYNQHQGWRVIDSYGNRKDSVFLSIPKPFVFEAVGFNAANTTTARTITSTSTVAQYLGRAEFGYTSCKLRYRTTTAAGTVTWAEAAIASGTFNLGGNQTLTTRGYADTSGTYAESTGVKETTITLTGVKAGQDLYALFGNQAGTAVGLRAGLADNLTSGFVSSATARPSTMSADTTFTLGADTDAMLWVSCSFS